MTFVLDLLCT